jgi:Protein of unknown function (DUF3421)
MESRPRRRPRLPPFGAAPSIAASTRRAAFPLVWLPCGLICRAARSSVRCLARLSGDRRLETGMAVTAHFTPAHGTLPSYANQAGHESDKTPLYVARAEYEGGTHPGKYRSGWNAASISYGGREVWVPDYAVWTGHLSDGSPGQWVSIDAALRFDPVFCGAESDLTPLYAARASHGGSLQLGKWRKGWTAASIPYGGQELWLTSAEVLCPGVPLD